MRVEDGEPESQNEENPREPAGELHQHIRRLRAENVLRHAATESRAKTFALRPLHQDDKDHDQRDEHVNDEQNVNENVHRRAGNMAEGSRL